MRTIRGVDFTGIAYLGVLAFAGAIVWKLYSRSGDIAQAVSDTVGTVVDAVNPASRTNIVNRAANAVYQSTSGTDNTIGTRLAELFNDATKAADRAMKPTGIDLGSYADTVDRDDAAIGAFGRALEFGQKADAPSLDYSHLTRRYKRNP